MEQVGSTFKVPVTTIREVLPHSNADKLEMAVIYGFQVVVAKGRYKAGDSVIYCPIDAVLPQWLEDALFPPGSKIDRKSAKRRIKQIRIRGVPSQGIIIPFDLVANRVLADKYPNEHDLAKELGIIKYEPPEPSINVARAGGRKVKADENPYFHKYNGLENVKWYPEKFKADEIVVLQEKIHGMNARAALMPFVANSLWKKIKKFFGLAPKFQFCYGSNNVQIQDKSSYTGYYGEDIHGQVFKAIGVREKIKENETIYGEIYGHGIQKDYFYGCAPGEHKFVLFDVKVLLEDGNQKWLTPDEVNAYAKERGFDVTPEIYRGPYISLDFIKKFTEGDSVLCPSQKIREGVVIKAVENYDEFGNKRALKVISEAYLDNDNTDFH